MLPGGPPAPAGPKVVFNVDASLLAMFSAGGPGAAAMQSMMESLRAAGGAGAAAAAQPAAPLAAAAAAAAAALKPMYVRFKEDVEPFREDDIVEIVKREGESAGFEHHLGGWLWRSAGRVRAGPPLHHGALRRAQLHGRGQRRGGRGDLRGKRIRLVFALPALHAAAD